MRLYNIPQNSKIKIETIDGVEIGTFHHIDGMYSYCTVDEGYPHAGQAFHLLAYTPLRHTGKYYEIMSPNEEEKTTSSTTRTSDNVRRTSDVSRQEASIKTDTPTVAARGGIKMPMSKVPQPKGRMAQGDVQKRPRKPRLKGGVHEVHEDPDPIEIKEAKERQESDDYDRKTHPFQ